MGKEADMTPGVELMHVRVPVGEETIQGDLTLPTAAKGLVIFAHGSGSSRHSPRNQAVARVLQTHDFATLLADLLTEREEAIDNRTGHLRFDIDLLAQRVSALIEWTRHQPYLEALRLGLFGASTGAAAALVAAAERPQDVAAVVSRGGRPDLAGAALAQVKTPTLLLVGGHDHEVLELNRQAAAAIHGIVRLDIIEGATHLFEEPGTLDRVAVHAAEWFHEWLGDSASHDARPGASTGPHA
jgi:dienelactone hydrolase